MAILYLEDWERYPTAIPDFNTPNQSWVVLAHKYRLMGIKNWFFLLALQNPSLVGVDPYSPNLTSIQKELILIECQTNPWYLFREVLRAPDGDGMMALDANRGNIALFWCVLNSFITYLQQIRQTGKSFNTRFLVVAFHVFLAHGATHILFTKGDLRRDEIKNYKKYRRCLPKWMWYLESNDTDNQYEFTTMMNGNITYSYVPQNSKDDATGVGRGKTPDFINVDEPPFLSNAETSIPALMASTTNSFDKARKKKSFHAILYTTTAGDLSTESGKYVYEKIKKKAMHFSEILFDSTNRNDAVEMIMANSKCEDRSAPYVDITFNHIQLGYDDDWLRGKIATANGTIDQTRRDFLGQWTFGSSHNPLGEKLLKKIRDAINTRPIPIKHETRMYVIKYHLDPAEVKRRTSVLGLDTSEAIGRDAITGVLIDVETGEVLATFMIGEGYIPHFSAWFADMIEDHPNMTVIPESKSTWRSICDDLIIELSKRGIDPGRRIYSRIVDEAVGSSNDQREYREYSRGAPSERKYFQYRSKFGFPTNGTLREELYGKIFKEATRENPTLIRDSSLIDELSSLVEKNDRIDHKASGHDDHVISWLLAQWLLRRGRNLDHYGIDNRRVLSRTKTAAVEQTPKQLMQNMKQQRLQSELEKLIARMAAASSVIERKYLESRISSVKSELDVDDVSEIASVDNRSEAAREERKGTRTLNNTSSFRKSTFTPFTYKRAA